MCYVLETVKFFDYFRLTSVHYTIFSLATFLALFKGFDGYIERPVQLDCEFTQTSTCRWRNAIEADDLGTTQEWFITNQLNTLVFSSIPRGKSGPDDYFAAAQASDGIFARQVAVISDVIRCQRGPGTFRMFLWKNSPSAMLAVCVRKPPVAGGLLVCGVNVTESTGPQWRELEADTPGISEPFQFVIMAFLRGGLDAIGIDSIRFSAQLCDPPQELSLSANGSELLISKREPRLGGAAAASTSVFDNFNISSETRNLSLFRQVGFAASTGPELDCVFAECNFEFGMCDFEAFASGRGSWRKECRHLFHEGAKLEPPEGHCYVVARSASTDSTLILASRSFLTSTDTLLEFLYFLPVAEEGRLSVCIGGFENCPWQRSSPPRQLEMWWKQSIRLSPGKQQIIFVVDQLPRRHVIAIDAITLRDVGTSGGATCTVLGD